MFSSFFDFKKWINELGKYRSKFFQFKLKLDFDRELEINKKQPQIAKNKKLRDILVEGIDKIKDNDVKNILKGVLDEK